MKKNNHIIFNWVTFFIWIVLVLVLIQFHENWRDEAQAWFIVKDLSIIDIFKQLKYEGHPFLWYMVLLPFTKLGFDYCVINYISAFCVGISVYLILFKTNFSKFLKIVICFSPGILYFFPVIARSYCLIPPLIIGIMLLHDKKEYVVIYNVLILLLLNTHLLVAPFCLILIFSQFIDLIKRYDKKRLCGFLISCIGVFILFLQLFGCKGINDETVEFFNILGFFLVTFVYFCIVVISIILGKFNKNEKKHIVLFFVSILGFYFVIFYSGFSSPQKILIISLFFIFLFYFIKSKVALIYLITCFLLLFSPYYVDVMSDFKKNYSSSKELSSYIEKNIKKYENIVVVDDYVISSIAGYSDDYNYINIFENNSNRFITWSKERNLARNKFINSENLCEYIEDKLDEASAQYVIITDNYFDILSCEKWELLYKTKEALWLHEQYKFYFVSK